jgi:O-antigen ligase
MASQVKDLSPRIINFRLTQIIYLTGIITTYAISPWSNYDPISLPKMFTLAAGAFTLLGFLLGYRKQLQGKYQKALTTASVLFFFFMITSLFMSGHKILPQIWGTFGRNTGLLTYTSLLILLIATHLLRDFKLYERILFVFIFGATPMTIYGLIQLSGNDPIGWSEKAVFGTLGNINFLSAYFGMTSVAAIAIATSKAYRSSIRIFIVLLAITNIALATSTNSIQGPIIFITGLAAIIFFYVTQLRRRRIISLAIYVITFTSAVAALINALFNKGPLASVIFQPSVIFRGDYMHAGWKMMLEHPLFGVGLDNYGDWYRELRGEISTLRTGPGRISNTAHNIFLDVGSNGGVFLGLAYLVITFLSAFAIIGFIRRGTITNPVILSSSATWIAYQIQSLVSINQIGVGVWGWIFSGILIGLKQTEISISSTSQSKAKISNFKDLKGKTVPASITLYAFAGGALGVILAFPPLYADSAYRTAANSGQFESIYSATKMIGSTEFHSELLLEYSMKRNLESEIRLVADDLLKDYPRNFFAWRLLSVATTGTEEERQSALERARELDPFNPELR